MVVALAKGVWSLVRGLMVLFVVLLVLPVGSLLITDFGKELQALESWAGKRAGASVRVRGGASLRFGVPPRIVLRDVVVKGRGRGNQLVWMRVRQVEAELDGTSLLYGKIKASRLHLVGVDMCVRGGKGPVNIDKIARQVAMVPPAAGPLGATGVPLFGSLISDAGSVSIAGASVTLLGAGASKPQTILIGNQVGFGSSGNGATGASGKTGATGGTGASGASGSSGSGATSGGTGSAGSGKAGFGKASLRRCS